MLLLLILIVILFWPDVCEAALQLRRMSERWEIRRTARHATVDLDLEYERLVDLHR